MTKNKTTVKPQSNHIFVYTKQPTTKNTKPGDVVLYKKEVWINDGNIVMSIPSIDLDDYIDKNSTVLKPLTKNYVVEEALKENTMENYIVINGKRAELTEEQLNSLYMFNRFAQMAKEQFGLTITPKETAGETFKTLFGVDFSDCSERKNPFNSELNYRDYRECYYMISPTDGIIIRDIVDESDERSIINANSFNDKDFANQVYLHELLNRKLLKYAYDNEAEDVEWDCNSKQHYYIFFDYSDKVFSIATGISIYKNEGSVYFSKQEVAENAIEDIVKPFMEEHPEFIW